VAESHPLSTPLGVHVGSVWLELKYIPDRTSGRQYGPYLCALACCTRTRQPCGARSTPRRLTA
jgi:hypothetical protein